MMRHEHRIGICWTACLLLSGCSLLAPLEDVQPTRPYPPPHARTSAGASGAVQIQAGRDSPVKPTRDAGPLSAGATASSGMSTEADGGPAKPMCETTALNECNATNQCGCELGAHCGLDENESSIACSRSSLGMQDRGQSCQQTSDCQAGLECANTKLCSAYCARDADCEQGELCVAFENQRSHQLVAGAGACLNPCDPVVIGTCPKSTYCKASLAAFKVHQAVCSDAQNIAFTARGEDCSGASAVCEPMTACSHFGPERCTPLCRTAADCPNELHGCYIRDRFAGPDDRIGDCWFDPCDDSTLPDPPAWTEGSVTTAAQTAQCQAACGPKLVDDIDCVKLHCAQKLARCLVQAREACIAKSNAVCRREYVAANCTDNVSRIGEGLKYDECVELHPQCGQTAEMVCTTST